MGMFTRILIGLGVSSMLGAVIFASSTGLGVKRMPDKRLKQDMRDECPDYQRDSKGKCPPRAFRSFFFVPYGGGVRSGK